mmetsp:Transcript_12915/g.14824  ORF Transcript_12915/g.14824 Transcript_12915/m.14824 type:complete len:166 (-) Transcript_12915:61-558(-)
MADDEMEMDQDQILSEAPPTFPTLNSLEEFNTNVLADEEFLVVVVVTSSLCQHSASLRTFFTALAEPKPQATKARCVQVVVPGPGEEIFSQLKLHRTPSVLFYLKGTQRGPTFSGTNQAKIEGLFRNAVLDRNEEMREYDEAKLAAAQPAVAEGDEEGEEAEEDA